jgi:5-oxoprolinase (ATP-hydrolysing) subunit C
MSAGAALVAVDPGPFTTLQDAGRRGWQRYGVPTSGAMDAVSLAAANALVGNAPGTAALELMVAGGEWQVDAPACRLAVTGGDFAIWVDGRPLRAYRSVTLERGSRMRIATASDAVWGYLAVAGGFALQPKLGSLSTHARSGIGGVEGRAVRAGDALPLARSDAPLGPERSLEPRRLPGRELPIRVVLGPQDDYFPPEAIATFLGSEYRVTHEADRMGYRLTGAPVAHGPRGFNIVSDGVTKGSVQIPGSGQPIVLLMDCQPTGGYPKIATVISVDLPKLAQRGPGTAVRFTSVDVAEAQRIHRETRRALERVPDELGAVTIPTLSSEWLLGHNLIDGVLDVSTI